MDPTQHFIMVVVILVPLVENRYGRVSDYTATVACRSGLVNIRTLLQLQLPTSCYETELSRRQPEIDMLAGPWCAVRTVGMKMHAKG